MAAIDIDDRQARLTQRLALASQHKNMGEGLTRKDYVALFVVTVAVPAVLMVVGWFL